MLFAIRKPCTRKSNVEKSVTNTTESETAQKSPDKTPVKNVLN